MPGPEIELVRGQVRELLAHKEPPTGFIVKEPQWVKDVSAAIEEQRPSREDIEVVSRGVISGNASVKGYVHLRPQMSNVEVADLIGSMLARLRQRLPLQQNTVIVPYELCGAGAS